MARNYFIQRGDTLRKLARRFYGQPELSERLGQYNGLLSQDWIRAGQRIEIPSRRELLGAGSVAESTGFAPPAGLDGIISVFGNLYEFIRADGTLDPRWESEQLARAVLPFPIPLSWDPRTRVTRILCHSKLVEVVRDVFAAIDREGLRGLVRTYGGCFHFRPKRTSAKLSTHSWGIALDLNPDSNPLGKPGDMDPQVVEVFRRFGFKWGGDWPGSGKDPMHFQYCTGY